MKIRVNYFFCDEPELFIPLKDWSKYFPDDQRPDELKEYALHLTDEQFKGLLASNAEPSHDLAPTEPERKADLPALVRTLKKFTAKLEEQYLAYYE